jgi:hypothetical protein
MEQKPIEFAVRGEVDVSKIELQGDVPLRIAAVHDGQILAAERLDVARRGRIPYQLSFPLPFPCGFHILVGRFDASDAVFVGDPVIRQWIPPHQAQRPAGRSR